MRAAGLLALCLLLATVASAQERFDPDTRTLYANGDGEVFDARLFMATEPRGTLDAVGHEPGPGGSITWSFALDPPLDEAVLLDANGTITVVLHLGGGLADAGVATVSTRLLHGDDTVGEGEARQVLIRPVGPQEAGQPYPAETWTFGVQKARLEPGAELVWEVHAQDVTATGLFLGMGDLRGQSRLDVPVRLTLGVVEGPVEEPVDASFVPLLVLAAGLVLLLRRR